MSEWKTAKLGAIVPDQLSGVIDSVKTVAGTVSSILGVVSGVLGTAKNFLVTLPTLDAASALLASAEAFKNDFGATGIYMLNLWDYPLHQIRRNEGYGEDFSLAFETDVGNSFFNKRDPNRPQFEGGVSALILVCAADSVSILSNLLRIQKTAFSWWREVESVHDRLQRISMEIDVKATKDAIKKGQIKLGKSPSEVTTQLIALNVALQQSKSILSKDQLEVVKPFTPTVKSTPSQIQQYISKVTEQAATIPYPSFEVTSLKTIVPPIPDVIDGVIMPMAASIAAGKSIVDTVTALIQTIELKVEALNSIVKKIDAILGQLDALIENSGLSAVYVESSEGMKGLVKEIKATTNKPLGKSSGFYSGIVLVSGGTGISVFRNLFATVAG